MTKPTWHPLPPTNHRGDPLPGWRFCPCCTWRGAVGSEFCPTCLAVAAQLGGPKDPPPDPPRLTVAAWRRHGDPTGLLPLVLENNARVTAEYLANRREEAGT